jgi:RNA polymerase sigma-70 factor (ECF subfamily)
MSNEVRELNVMDGGLEWFATTHWSVVLRAKDVESPQSGEALEQLCRAYWYPLYAYVRRKGHSPHDAQDLTQEFFARLLRGSFLDTIERRKGRFRTFLLVSLEHFLAKEWARGQRQKRGGGIALFSLDDTSAENRYALEPVDQTNAQKLYERRWAITLLDRAMERLKEDCRAEDQTDLFESAKHLLTGDRGESSYAELAAHLGLTEGAFKVAVHRLRQKYGKLLRAEIAQTVTSRSEVEEEIRFLFAALAP